MPQMVQNVGRYARHVDLIGPVAWERLCSLRVLVAGCGGLGSHVLDLLARLAPMRLELWDPGVLDEPDLNRQSLYVPADLGSRKAEAAKRRLLEINGDLRVAIRTEPIQADSLAGTAFGGIDACFDCLDSFAARAGLEKAVIAAGKRQGGSALPIFHGGVSGFYGQAATITPPEPGYGQLFGPGFETVPADPKPVFPPAVAIVASLQVSEFIAWLKSDGEPRGLELVTVDCVRNSFDRIHIE